MQIDWVVVATIAAPIIALFVGAWVNRVFESRPALTSYWGHVSAFKYTQQDGTRTDVFTHAVILRNAGRRTAHNVRLLHNVLPDFAIQPSVPYAIAVLPDGTKEIVIPTLVPQEQLTISYLYFPPLTYAQVNAGIKSDEGFAKTIPVLLQRQYPSWFNLTGGLLMLMGLVTVVYLAYVVARWLLSR